MAIHHTKLKQANQIGCYISPVGSLTRIFWPQRAVELFGASVDEALLEMKAAQSILTTFADYGMLTYPNSCKVTLLNRVTDKQLLGNPQYPTLLLARIEAGEDRWGKATAEDVLPPPLNNDTHIGGIPKSGAIAYREGVPAGDNPYLAESDDAARWDQEWDDAAEKADATPEVPEGTGSVITGTYRSIYAEKGHPTHCGDELAVLLNNICHNKGGTNLELFESICAANGVNLENYNRTSKGWQGRLRMTGRNLLSKKVAANGGKVLMPEGMAEPFYQLTGDWLFSVSNKFKPKDTRK